MHPLARQDKRAQARASPRQRFKVSGHAKKAQVQDNAVNLSAKYLALSGGTLTGTLNGTTINASANLQENAVNLSAKYLALSGGILTGALNLNTTTLTNQILLQNTGTN